MPKNIFVIALQDSDLDQLRSVRNADDYRFHGLIPYADLVGAHEYRIPEILEGAEQTLVSFPGTVDAIIGHWDFPTTSLLPILRSKLGLQTPSLESVLKCEDKYWSRLEQAAVLPDAVPPFTLVDPFAIGQGEVDLPYPFWLKPCVSHSSYLGFRIGNHKELGAALPIIRENIGTMARPFNYIRSFSKAAIGTPQSDGYLCIAEGLLSGRLCTVEGYVYRGRPRAYAIIDSLRGPNRSSFHRYQYPSALPPAVQERISRAAEKLIAHMGLDNTPFNAEFFWNEKHDRITLLEINARLSKSHAPLFKMVTGASHHEVAIELALGQEPDFPRQEGAFNVAAKMMPRAYRDATVSHVPSQEEIRDLEAAFDGAQIHLAVSEGMRLSDLPNQDAYSYELGEIYLGANNPKALLTKYRALLARLDVRLGPLALYQLVA